MLRRAASVRRRFHGRRRFEETNLPGAREKALLPRTEPARESKVPYHFRDIKRGEGRRGRIAGGDRTPDRDRLRQAFNSTAEGHDRSGALGFTTEVTETQRKEINPKRW